MYSMRLMRYRRPRQFDDGGTMKNKGLNIAAGILGGLGSLASTTYNLSQTQDTESIEDQINDFGNHQWSSQDSASLLNEYSNLLSPEKISYSDVGKSASQIIGGIGSAMASGASTGMSVGGPWGALIGAGAGLLSSGTGAIIGSISAKNKIKKLNKQIDEANSQKMLGLNAQVQNIDKTNVLNMLANYAAWGGKIEQGKSKTTNEYKIEELMNKPIFEDYYKTVPYTKNDTVSYNLRRAYALAPYEDMIRFASEPDFHLNSAYLNPATGEYEFMKSKNHPTIDKELEWYNSNSPEAREFRDKYELDTSGEYYKYVPKTNIKKKKYDFGGALTHGGVFDNGVTIIGNGGTHEENPMDGVPMGVAPDGVPNLVEEGEVKFNDYIFSNRLSASNKLLTAHKLPVAYAKHTFADIAKKLNKESSERPNDPISKKGLLSSMTRLQQAQEQLRAEKQNNKYAKGGHLFAGGGPYSEDPEVVASYDYAEDDIIPTGTKINYNPYAIEGSGYGTSTLINTSSTPNSTTVIESPESPEIPKKNYRANLGWMRYIPAFGAGLGVLSDALGWTNTSDSKGADLIGSAVDNLSEVKEKPIGNYLTYKPLDRDYYINKLNTQAGATRRAIMNQAGGNRGTAMAGLLAADYNAQASMGDLARQAEEYNLAQRERVENFNRGTNQFNAQMALQAAIANKDNDRLRLQAKTSQAQLLDQAEALASTGRAANLTNLFESLGNIGIDALNRDDALRASQIARTGNADDLRSYFGKNEAFNILIDRGMSEEEAKKALGIKAYGGKIRRRKGLTY